MLLRSSATLSAREESGRSCNAAAKRAGVMCDVAITEKGRRKIWGIEGFAVWSFY